jgi:hypothetical protein
VQRTGCFPEGVYSILGYSIQNFRGKERIVFATEKGQWMQGDFVNDIVRTHIVLGKDGDIFPSVDIVLGEMKYGYISRNPERCISIPK